MRMLSGLTLVAVAVAAVSALADSRGVSKAEYLDLMEDAVSAYSNDHIEDYISQVERDGVQEHGFPRLTSNLGVLVANGRAEGRRELFRRMMTVACRDAAKGKMKLEGNEFSVKELAIALVALEKSKAFDKPTTDAWRADLSRIDAKRCYTCQPKPGAERAYNWCVFGCASEQARIAAGLGGDSGFVERYVSDQLRWFDANGMYRDPGQPAVYDFVTRLQFMWVLHCGYAGPSRARLAEMLEKSAEPTLAMLSASGEIPYGGRSNQFLHNNLFYAAVCEWYAAQARAKGDARDAARFALAAREAVDAVKPWLKVRPVRHVKNLYPRREGVRESGVGCEKYAYFDKYMVTMGSWAMMAHAFAEENPGAVAPSDGAPSSFATSQEFHLAFLRAGEYSAQFDYNADTHYDCDGLGRVQRRGAPGAICMSVPCAAKPNYRIEMPNSRSLAIAPATGEKLELKGSGHDASCAWADWKAGALDWSCRLDQNGLKSVLSGEGDLAIALPAFAFDGEKDTAVSCDGKRLSIRYGGWECLYETDGAIVDTGDVCCNRNGRYRVFEARGLGRLGVAVSIRRIPLD